MGIKDRLVGDFSSLPPFADAIAAGVNDEIQAVISPLQSELEQIKTQLAQLGIAVQTAQSSADSAQASADSAQASADSAQQTADSAKQAIPSPTPTPSVTPPVTDGGTPSTSPPATPQPTPTPSASPRKIVFVLALPDPIFVGNILAGEAFRSPATITTTPSEGAPYAGSQITLEATNIDSTLSFVGWYDANNALLGSSNPLSITLPNVDNFSITAKFSPR